MNPVKKVTGLEKSPTVLVSSKFKKRGKILDFQNLLPGTYLIKKKYSFYFTSLSQLVLKLGKKLLKIF